MRALVQRLGIGGVCVGIGILLGLFAAPIVQTFREQRAYRDYVVSLRSLEGATAPDATGRLLKGAEWKLSDQRGKVVVLDFWATWCAPCIEEFPKLEQLARRYASHSDFALVGINLDRELSSAEGFIRENNVAWPQMYERWTEDGTDGLRHAFGVMALPSIWVIDRDGTVVAAHITVNELPAILEQVLGEAV